MGPTPERAIAAVLDALRALVAGRDVVLVGTAVRGSGPLVEEVTRLGAGRVFLLAGTEGTGPDLDPAVPRVVVPATVRSMTEEVLAAETVIERMSRADHAAVDAFDPGRRALVLGSPFTASPTLGGRPVVAHRPEAWADLEDKATVDELLAAAGVPAPPHEVVDAAGAVAAAARRDAGDGVVLAGGGRNGGAERVRWVQGAEAVRAAASDLAETPGGRGPGLGRVRVAAFVEGVPCSLGGLVTGQGVAVLRPVENLVLRRGRTFAYCGVATLYDPPAATRHAMEAAVRRVGAELERRVGLRGGFSVDGIVGPDGSWLATEVNVRLSGGFGALSGPGSPLSLPLVNAALRAGDGAGLDPATLEAAIGPPADATRVVRVVATLSSVPAAAPDRVPVRAVGRDAQITDDEGAAHGELLLGESAMGGLVMARITSGAGRGPTPGAPAGPLAASLLDRAAERWGVATSGLRPAG